MYVCAAYAVATSAGAGVAYGVGRMPGDVNGLATYPLVLALIADLVGTVVIWLSAILVNNSSLYDAYWSVFTPFAFWYWFLAAAEDEKDVPTMRVVLIFFSAWVWALRLTRNWAVGWPGLHHEDFRYVDIAAQFADKGLPKWVYWVVGSFAGIMLFPTLLVFAGSVPMFLALYSGVDSDGASEVGALDFVATAVCVGAAVLQYVADEQMRVYRKKAHPPGSVMEVGVWRYSRHPNYFGEQLLWLGMYLHALAANTDYYWSGFGFVAMVVLFTFVSVPLMETRMLKKRPAYKRYQQQTSMMIPFFRFSAPAAEPSST